MTGHEKTVPMQQMRRDKRLDPEHRMRLDTAIHMQGRGWMTGRDGGRPWTLSRTNRVVACLGALVILLLISPILLGLALAIKFSSPGPVMFVQKRTGYRGRMFGMYKFRTMVADAEAQLLDLADGRSAGNAVMFKMKNDPRVTSKLLAAGEWYFDGTYVRHRYTPTTFTAGAVAHATKRLSLFYNLSRNNGQPRFDRTVLPNGEVPEPTEGRGRDYGVMLDVLGDDRLFIRTTWFQTEQLNDSPILPGGNALGVDNLTTMLTQLRNVGKISQADYDRQAITWTSASIDIFTEGVEVEVVANPTKSLTLRAGYSNSERRRQNFFTEVFAFFDTRVPQWRTLLKDHPAELATFETAVSELYSELGFQVDRQNSPFGSRPHKLNGTARYAFREGTLRGAFVGGSVRYNGKNFMSWDKATGQIYWGNESVLADAFAGYRFRLPWAKVPATVQLNVKNVGNHYLANVGRYNDNYTGVRRVYLNEPRSWRLTTTLDF